MSTQVMSLDRQDPSSSSSFSSASSSRARRSTVSARGVPLLVSHTSSSVFREQTSETSIAVSVWHPNTVVPTGSALSKAPLLREVPQVKRKLTRKDRDSIATGYYDGLAASGSVGSTDPKAFANLKNAAPSWLREKPSKTKLAGSSIPQQRQTGAWKRATLTCRETGALLIYGEDRAMMHSISVPELEANDIRLVDDSLFNRPHVLGIFARPSTLTAGLRSPIGTVRLTSSPKSKDEPIYLCFSASRKMYKWRALLRTFARPEIYGLTHATKSLGTHRRYRQIDMTFHELRIHAERPPVTERAQRASGIAAPSSLDAEDAGGVAAVTTANAMQAQDASNAAYGNRSSSEAPARPLTSILQRNPTSGSQEMFETHSAKHEHENDDSKSSISAYDLANVSGPITGTPSRQYENISFTPPIGTDSDRRGSDGSSQSAHQHIQPSSCFCKVWMNGDVVARSKIGTGTTSMAFFDKFSLQDLSQLSGLHVEVLQSWRPGKFVQLGTIDVPIETMRRGENVEGWYPVWAPPRMEEAWSRRDENAASYTREMVGELKIALYVLEETVLPAKRYADVMETLNGPACVGLMRRLCKELEEDRVVSHLVDVFTSGGTIVERLSDLTEAESSSFGTEATLLFRANSLLSRAVDKFQRRYCIDWLESCVGPSVRKVCNERIRLEPNDASPSIAPVSTGNAALIGGSAITTFSGDESSIETLRALSCELWDTIYANRHKCPPDLRSALATIRRTVNTRFNSAPGPGVQSVGSFIFLRLICPAITSPNLYGLLGSAPDPQSSKTLMYLAKVFLALANKRPAFDKDKEPWLTNLNDFLKQHSTAFDDFITVVSTEAEDAGNREPLGDENDFAFQRLIKDRLDGLPTLHRESIPRSGMRLDSSLAIASFVSYIVRGATVEPYEQAQGEAMAPHAGHKEGSGGSDEQANVLDDFVDMCCDVEDLVGYHLDRAGYNPEPLPTYTLDPVGGVHRTTSIFTANKGSPLSAQPSSGVVRAKSPQSGVSAPPGMQRTESSNSIRLRRATVSEGHADLDEAVYRPKMSMIGEDSFLHAQFPKRFANMRQTELHRMDEETAPGSVQVDLHESQTLEHRLGGQAAFTGKDADSNDATASAAYDTRQRPSPDYPHPDYRAFFHPQATAEFSPTPAAALDEDDDLSAVYHDARGGVDNNGGEEAKKKRGWWRRKK